MSLKEGRDCFGELATEDHGGVFFSASEIGIPRAGTTVTGFEFKNDANGTLTPHAGSTTSSTCSLLLLTLVRTVFVLLCSFCISRRKAGPFANLAPPQAGPSCFGVVTCGTQLADQIANFVHLIETANVFLYDRIEENTALHILVPSLTSMDTRAE